MTDEKQLTREVEELSDLREIVRAYAEISSSRIKKERDAVLFARRFLADLGEVFDEVRRSYAGQVAGLARGSLLFGRKKQTITFLPHNGKTVALFLSANARLYGDLLEKIFGQFVADLRGGSEATVVGRMGMNLFRAVETDRPVTYFDFPDEKIDPRALSRIIAHLVPYEEVHVYYGRYFREGSPRAANLNLSSQIQITPAHRGESQVRYIFEPSLEGVLKFFEKEIFGNLLEQAVRELQLAKFASRLISVNQSDVNIDDRLTMLLRDKMVVKHRLENRRQTNSLGTYLGRFEYGHGSW